MPKLLTKRKAKWVEQRNPDVVRGSSLQPNAASVMRYQSKLDDLIRRMSEDVERRVKRLMNGEAADDYFDEEHALDASIASQARILMNALTKKWEKIFADQASTLAEQVANAADATSSSALHSSLQQLSGGLSLKTTSLQGPLLEVWKATVNENVSLIKSIPQQYLSGVQGAVQRSITTGNGLKDLVPYLQKHKAITDRRARMIANDQTRKAFNNLSKGKMEGLGVTHFEWRHTSGSNEPRQLHIKLNGQIFSFDDLPVIDENTGERGIPGQAINCRCQMIPVLDFSGDE